MQKLLQFIVNHWLLVSLFVIAVIWLLIEESRHQGAGGVKLTSAQATQLINQEKAVVLDIRESDVFKEGHIIGSINIAPADIGKQSKKLEKYKQRPIILVCGNGQKSPAVMHQLKKLGFTQVRLLSGGIATWKNDNLPLVKK